MSAIKYSLFLLALLAGAAASAQYTDEINSNRPGESQSAFSVGKSVMQLETGVYGIKEKHPHPIDDLPYDATGIGAELDFRWGLFYEQLELSLNTQYQADSYKTALGSERRNGFRQVTIGGKYLIYDPAKNYVQKVNIYSWKANHKFSWRQFLPAVGVYAGVNLNFSNPYTFETDPNISPKLMIITQNQFSGGYVVVTNIIADKVTSDFPSYGAILTVTKGINEKWSAFLEGQGYKSDYYADMLLRGGAAYLLRENFQIDGSLSFNMKNTPSIFYGGVGISWRFDKNYKPVLIRSGKDDKDKDKKGKKDKKKKKKRKDEVEPEVGPTTK